jgi:DNA invertase Pin-like site-specific DNA recombinase
MSHVAVYARVSSKSQDTKSQKHDLERWIAAQDQPVKWYHDKFTGKVMERPGWLKLEADMRAGLVSGIVVWRLDRLGRTAKGLTALFSELAERKVKLFSLKDCLDLDTPAGRLMAHVLASVAQYETEVRAERVRAGQEVARAKGKKWGGRKLGSRAKVTTEKEAVIRSMHATGAKIAVIARTVELSRQTVYAWLNRAS